VAAASNKPQAGHWAIRYAIRAEIIESTQRTIV